MGIPGHRTPGSRATYRESPFAQTTLWLAVERGRLEDKLAISFIVADGFVDAATQEPEVLLQLPLSYGCIPGTNKQDDTGKTPHYQAEKQSNTP